MRTLAQNQFDGGILNDPRTPSASGARLIMGFDALTNPYKLTPYHDTENGDSSASTHQIQNYCVAKGSGGVYKLFGLGVNSNNPEVFIKDLTTGGTHDLGDATWATITNNTGAVGNPAFQFFVYYANTGLIYLAQNGVDISTFNPTGSAWNDTEQALTYTNIAQGLVHPKDDILYVPYDNKIASNNAGSWTTVNLTLPASLYITSIAAYGNYLAIGCANLNGLGGSKVYLWDRNATLATLSEMIEWDEGILKFIHEVGGVLVGGSQYSGNQTLLNNRIVFKYYDATTAGGASIGAKTLLTLEATAITGFTPALYPAKQRVDQRVYFQMATELDGIVRAGVWSLGKNLEGTVSLIHELPVNNNTALGVSDSLSGFYKVGDFFFQSYNASSAFAMSKTNDQASYTASSIFQSLINPKIAENYRAQAGERESMKSLLAMAVGIDKLTGSQQVVLEYRVDGGSWITIFTATVDSSSAQRNYVREGTFDATGKQFQNGREYEYRITSTGGASITALRYKFEGLETLI